MADYNSKYSGEQIEQLLQQAGGSSDKVEVVRVSPEVDGDVWIYHIPAGKFVELIPINGTSPSYIHFELLDPVEYTMKSEDDWTSEHSKYHFMIYSPNSLPFGFGTNTNPNASPDFLYGGTLTTDTPYAEFDVTCALIHPLSSTGNSDMLSGIIIAAPLHYSFN